MLIKDNVYSLEIINLNKFDEIFINISYDYSTKFPSRWNDLIEDILFNKLIVYFKDTTLIIQVNYLYMNNIEFLFKFIKTLLNNKIVIKVIYKKEFIIVHFNAEFHIELIKIKSILYSIPLYKFIKINNFNDFKIYLYCILKIENYEKIIPFIIKTKNNIFIFDTLPDINLKNENIEVIYLFKVKKRGYQQYRCLQILDNLSITYDNLYKLIV